jgi:TIR domain
LKTELCFLDVPVPQSGHVVDQLREEPGIAAVAAVYSGVDVVALLEGTDSELKSAYQKLTPEQAPNINSYERFSADSVIPGASSESRERSLSGACTAFVRCSIRTEETTISRAAEVLATLPGVVKLFPSAEHQEVVLEVLAPDKKTFDARVMSSVQGQWSVVRSTRTYMVINGMQWHRSPTQEGPEIFISVAESNISMALWLSDRIREDIGLSSWTFKDIPIGTPSWTRSIDEAIDAASFHIFLVSEAALASPECQREFGQAEALDIGNICCLLLPGCAFEELPVRYQQRQCLSAADFQAYPKLLDWIHSRLKNPGQRPLATPSTANPPSPEVKT